MNWMMTWTLESHCRGWREELEPAPKVGPGSLTAGHEVPLSNYGA